ncbi:MAG: D-aminoacyl-tRNA deacylase [Thermaerobacterales bacterium]
MRAVVQRVKRGAVRAAGQAPSEIGAGLVVLLGIARTDTTKDAAYLADKTANLRIFPDEEGKMNRSLLDAGGQALVVSQFTLYGDARQGRRPGFSAAAAPEDAEPLYEHFIACLAAQGVPVATGRFQADMLVEIANDGPVTLLLDSGKFF